MVVPFTNRGGRRGTGWKGKARVLAGERDTITKSQILAMRSNVICLSYDRSVLISQKIGIIHMGKCDSEASNNTKAGAEEEEANSRKRKLI